MFKTNNEGVEREIEPGTRSTSDTPLGAEGEVTTKRHTRRKHRTKASEMEMTTVADVHKSAPARVHSSARRNRSQSRHERHKCHKHKQRIEENELVNQVSQLKSENHLLNRRLNASLSSLDSGLPVTEALPPFEIDLKKAYQHIKYENSQLIEELKSCRVEAEKMKQLAETERMENRCLQEDLTMLKNLVYRLNVELEKFQDLRERMRGSEDGKAKTSFELPQYYNKNFLKPLVPLLKAYSETIEEKNEIIDQLEQNFERFSASFNELLKENETLYKELEAKLTRSDDSLLDELKLVRNELNITKEEKELYMNQAKIEAEKLKEVQAVYQTRVSLVERERDVAVEKLHEARADVYTLRGKYSVVKQELERLRSDDESRVPQVVHSASIAECKRLFQNLKNEHQSEKQDLLYKLKECETKLARKEAELKKNEEERLSLEQGNFDLAFECDSLKKRISELESREINAAAGETVNAERDRTIKQDLHETKKLLRDALKKNTDLDGKLLKTKKKLQQSLAFAEDLVREQEGLLAQLHEKQKENMVMVTQFGSLKKKLKNVEKGAQAGLDSVEDKIKSLEAENLELLGEVELLKKLLYEKEAAHETEETSS